MPVQHEKSRLSVYAKFVLALLPVMLVARGAQAQATFTVLYPFQGGTTDGATPSGNLLIVPGRTGTTLYGVTFAGGGSGCYHSAGCGTIYSVLLPNPLEKVVYSFCSKPNCADGSAPGQGLLRLGAKRYGTTYINNCPGCGNPAQTIFQVTAGGLTTLYTFGSKANDPSAPSSPLITDNAGNLYGTSSLGGANTCAIANDCGTVYQYNLNTKTESVIYNFKGGADGYNPTALVWDPKNKVFYGVTRWGGQANQTCKSEGNCGTVFKLTQSVTGWTESTVYSFQGNTTNDGQVPAGLLFLPNGNLGNLYGYTLAGGGGTGTGCFVGCGTLFKVDPGTGAETVVHRFAGGLTDGAAPSGLVYVPATNSLYGVTQSGGTGTTCYANCGTFFQFSQTGYSLLYNFAGGASGTMPTGLATDGAATPTFYGVMSQGGTTNSNCSSGCGVVYQLTP